MFNIKLSKRQKELFEKITISFFPLNKKNQNFNMRYISNTKGKYTNIYNNSGGS